MDSSPTISVIIPTYRHADFVLTAIESVFAQTYTDYELIVVNDGSPDNTTEVLRPLVESGRIRYVEQANQGQGGARNVGIGLARGQWLALLDDDDRWPIDKLAWQVDAANAHPEAVLIYGYSKTFDENGEWTERIPPSPTGNVREALFSGPLIRSPGQCLLRADAVAKIGGFDPAIWGMDDWDLYLRLSATGSFFYEHRVSLLYREHPGNAGRGSVEKNWENLFKLRQKHLGPHETSENSVRWRSMEQFLSRAAISRRLMDMYRHRDLGRWRQAWIEWRRLLANHPRVLRELWFYRVTAGLCLRSVSRKPTSPAS